jgi:protein SCO1/2
VRFLSFTLLGLAALAFAGVTLIAVHPPKREVKFEDKTRGVDIVDKPGARPSKDLPLVDHEGKAVRLGDYFDGTQPTILVLAYYECPMLCSLVLNGVLEGIKPLGFHIGQDYRVVTVSFDPKDTPAGAAAKRKVYVEAYERPVPPRGWDFLTGDPAVVKSLADSVGFTYKWDPDRKEFAHAAGVFVMSPDGALTRTLYGIKYHEDQVRLALTDASAGRLGSTWDRLILFCYHWDPTANSYALAARRVMQIGGGIMVLVLAGLLGLFWSHERRRPPPPPKEHFAT